MKNYAYLSDNIVSSIYNNINDNIRIGVDLFSEEMAKNMILIGDNVKIGQIYNPQTQTFSDYIPPEPSFNDFKTQKETELKAIILQQEQKLQRSSQEITEALLTKQEASRADIEAFNALHNAKKINQAKLLEVANAISKEEVEAIRAMQVEYKNGTWLEL